MFKRFFNTGFSLALVAALAACGSSGSDDTNGDDLVYVAPTSSAVAATYNGTISGLGSIVVNGVRFETVGANVVDGDDLYGSTSYNKPLAIGMTVALSGSADDVGGTGQASTIRILGGVRGYLSATPAANATLLNIASAQSVVVDSNTVYGGTRSNGAVVSTIAGLLANDAVEIYGVTQTNGNFLATRVTALPSMPSLYQMALRGSILALNTSANQYTVQTSSTDQVTVICASPGCSLSPSGVSLSVGAPVRVLAASASSLSGGVLSASVVQAVNPRLLTSFSGFTANYAKIKGLTQQVGSSWYVSGVEVTGANFTTPGVYVEVKGSWSGQTLVASQWHAENDRTVAAGSSQVSYSNELYGPVAGLSGSTFNVQGVTVNSTNAYWANGSLSSLQNGAYVEVKGAMSNGQLLASKIEIKTSTSGSNDDQDSSTLHGSQFEIYGSISNWTSQTSAFSLTSRGTVYAAQNVAQVRFEHGLPVNGSYVEAKGYMQGSTFMVVKLEVKNGYHDD